MRPLSAIACLLWLYLSDAEAFLSPTPHVAIAPKSPVVSPMSFEYSLLQKVRPETTLRMYNLPPGGGGGRGNDNVITQVLSGALTIGAIVLFFASPLGSIFFAVTNSLFLLAILTPVVLTIAFQVWKSLNTIEGTCPNCGAPQKLVLKDGSQVTVCFDCGALLQASPDGKSIELTTPPRGGRSDFIDMDDPSQRPVTSIFDQLFGGLGDEPLQQPGSTNVKEKETKFRREQTIIDVEVQKKDDP